MTARDGQQYGTEQKRNHQASFHKRYLTRPKPTRGSPLAHHRASAVSVKASCVATGVGEQLVLRGRIVGDGDLRLENTLALLIGEPTMDHLERRLG